MTTTGTASFFAPRNPVERATPWLHGPTWSDNEPLTEREYLRDYAEKPSTEQDYLRDREASQQQARIGMLRNKTGYGGSPAPAPVELNPVVKIRPIIEVLEPIKKKGTGKQPAEDEVEVSIGGIKLT